VQPLVNFRSSEGPVKRMHMAIFVWVLERHYLSAPSHNFGVWNPCSYVQGLY